MRADATHLVVEKGPDTGRRIRVPSGGARLGRSSKNDIVLKDPLLSRYHCRLFFKPGEGLCVTDLGSANETFVNGVSIREQGLRVNDLLTVGDTVLRVLDTNTEPAAPAGESPVDLGLSPAPAMTRPVARRLGLGPLLAIAITAGMAVFVAMRVHIMMKNSTGTPPKAVPGPASVQHTLEVTYEKIEANNDNIFRYLLEIHEPGVMSVQIDDLRNARHVRKEQRLEAGYRNNLAEDIIASGFFMLEPDYEGIQPDVLQSWDLSITVDRRTHRCRVVNRTEPEIFRLVREKLEESGKNELGLWAIPFSHEKLLELADAAHQLGRKLFDEREVSLENLSKSLQCFREADWYLETVEPKPDFYADILSGITDARRELDRRHEERVFRAERAIRLEDWEAAARELRDIVALIPQRSDPRHEEARRRLLDVENHLDVRK